MAALTYHVGDILDGRVYGDLPFYGVSMDWALSGVGTWKGKLNLNDPDVIASNALDLIQEAKTTLWVEQDGVIIWPGIIWSTAYDSDSGEMEVNAADFWSYLGRRIVTANLTYKQKPLKTIINDLLGYAFAPFAPPGLSASFVGTNDSQLVDWEYKGSDRKTVAELLESLAGASPGFDFRVDGYWLGQNAPGVRYVFGAPRIGRTVEQSQAYFDHPGNVVKYSETRDGSSLTDRLFVRGDDDGSGGAEYPFEDSSMYIRYPRYDSSASVNESSGSAVQRRGQYLHYARKRVSKKPSVSVRPDGPTPIGSYDVGDDTQLSITDARHPYGDEYVYRIATIAYDVDAQEATLTHWQDPNV